jgi:hypothetical protein
MTYTGAHDSNTLLGNTARFTQSSLFLMDWIAGVAGYGRARTFRDPANADGTSARQEDGIPYLGKVVAAGKCGCG